jgi:hypothetical protein
VASSSSTKRAAKLARKGKGKRVRFQGGTLFPMIVLGILVLGLAAIVYGRQTRPEADASPPTINDHWHMAYGFEICDADNFTQLSGNKEELDANGQLVSSEFATTGVHSHDDGISHWHTSGSRAVGDRAQLGVFLDVYGVELDDNSLKFPDDQGGKEYVEGETKCGDKDAELRVVVWDSFSDTGKGTTYVSDFNDIRMTNDGMAITIAFVPRNTEVTMPPWAPNLPELGAKDINQTNTPGTATSVPAGSAAPGATTAGSTPASAPTTPGTPSATSAPAPTATG